MNPIKTSYRIKHANGTFKNAGTDAPSWFNLETARALVNYSQGEQIVEHNGVDVLWEIF